MLVVKKVGSGGVVEAMGRARGNLGHEFVEPEAAAPVWQEELQIRRHVPDEGGHLRRAVAVFARVGVAGRFADVDAEEEVAFQADLQQGRQAGGVAHV